MNKKVIGLVLVASLIGNITMIGEVIDIQNDYIISEQAVKASADELSKVKEQLLSKENELNSLILVNNSLQSEYDIVKNKLEEEKRVSRGGEDFDYTKVLNVEITAYTHTGEATKSGVMPKVGRTIAVDPRIIPLGTKVYIEGVGYRIAEDTGGAVKGNIIDLFLNTEEECVRWGRKHRKIYVLK